MFDSFGEDVTRSMIGDEIRAVRSAKGISLGELAEKAEMSEQKLAEIEDGDPSFDLADLERIAEALNTHLKVNFEPLDLDEYDDDYHLDPGWVFSVGFLQEIYGEDYEDTELIEDFIQSAIKEKLARRKADKSEVG